MDNPKSNRSILPRSGLYEEEDGTCLPCGKSGHNLFAGEQGLTHNGPPLDPPQLAAGRKAEIRRKRIGLLFVWTIRAMSGIDSVTSHTGCDATSMCDGTSLFL